jgi:hypothetical protein
LLCFALLTFGVCLPPLFFAKVLAECKAKFCIQKFSLYVLSLKKAFAEAKAGESQLESRRIGGAKCCRATLLFKLLSFAKHKIAMQFYAKQSLAI